MWRQLAIFVLSPLLFGGAALAQSFDSPSIPGFSGIPGSDAPQFDPPSLDFDTGTSAAGAWEGQPAEGIAEALNPDFLNPLFLDESDPGTALLEFLAAVEEAVRRGLQQGRLLLDSDFSPLIDEPKEDVEK